MVRVTVRFRAHMRVSVRFMVWVTIWYGMVAGG